MRHAPAAPWLLAVLLAVLPGCAENAPPAAGDPPTPDTTDAPAATADRTWPGDGPIDYRQTKSYDLTGDGAAETVIVTAAGPSHDSLDVALTIRGTAGDTLWREQWPSLIYFNYDPLEGKADSTVTRIVRGHVEALLADAKFHAAGGLPQALSYGDPTVTMKEAARYHLAELDWRRSNGLSPAAPTPPQAHAEIDAASVTLERVERVVAEVMSVPSFMYYAGGEATYAIAWSSSEDAFVRIHSCC